MNLRKIRCYVIILAFITSALFLSSFSQSYSSPTYFIDIRSEEDFGIYGFPGSGTPFDPYIIEDLRNFVTETYTLYIDIFPSGHIIHLIIRNCYFKGTNSGLYIGSTIRALIANNTFEGSTLRMTYSSNSLIINNSFVNCRGGISISGSLNTICYNEFHNIENTAIVIGSILNPTHLVIDNKVHHNSFMNNNSNQVADYSVYIISTWYDETTKEGNYWSDWDGEEKYEIDQSDGIYDWFPLDFIPTNDSDGDSMPDNWELNFGLNTSINDAYFDNDSDGLDNLNEFRYYSHPCSNDTDSDGLPDGLELEMSFTPTDCDESADFDNDGLSNLMEFLNGTNPLSADSDSDGICDGWELEYGINPLFNDSHLDYDFDNLTNYEEFLYQGNPFLNDTDFDGISDFLEAYNYTTCLSSNDTDNDGLDDKWEIETGTNPCLKDDDRDLDRDGLSNIDEYEIGTLANTTDSDGDGYIDGFEVRKGSDPLNYSSYPNPSEYRSTIVELNFTFLTIVLVVLLSSVVLFYFKKKKLLRN